jgi:hypothetical protein
MRELKDELEVHGHVVMIESIPKSDTLKEIGDIMNEWEAKGYSKPNDVPEGEKKERFRQLMKSIGFKVNF